MYTLDEIAHYRKKVKEAQQQVERTPLDALAHYNLGKAWGEFGVEQQAELEYRKALELDPSHVHSHVPLGFIEFRRGNWQAGIFHYEKFVEAIQANSLAWHFLGRCYMEVGRLKDAIAAFENEEIVAKDKIPAKRWLGFVYLKLGETDRAKVYFKEVLSAEPYDVDVKEALRKIES